MVYTDTVNTLGENVHTIRENRYALVVTCKETGVLVNVDKTKYMVMCQDRMQDEITI